MRLNWIYAFSLMWACPAPCKTIINRPTPVLREKVATIESDIKAVTDLNPIISCVRSIAIKHFDTTERVSLLIPNFLDGPGISTAFFTGLVEELGVYSVSENFTEVYVKAHSAVLLVRNSTDLALINNLRSLCSPRCKYAVCLLTDYRDKASFLAEAEAVVESLRKSWIVNAVIVASVGGKFVIAGSYSFEADTDQVPKKPEILGSCSALTAKSDNKIFHKLMMNNTRVNVTVFHCPPYAMLAEDKEGDKRIRGFEGELFEVVAKSLDIKLNRLNISTEINDSLHEELIGILSDPGESDVVFCGLYLEKEDRVEYSIPYEVEKVVWLVPSTHSLTLVGLVTPLHTRVWFAVLGLLGFAGLMKLLVFRKMEFLGLLALILGVSLPRQPSTLSNRIYFLSWVIFGYVITQSYLASLAGQLLNTNYETIKTMQELENSGIPLGGTARHKDLFKDDNQSVIRKIYKRYKTLSTEEYDVLMDNMNAGGNNSMALVVELTLSHSLRQSEPYKPHTLQEALAIYPVALATWKGLPYLDQINKKISSLNEAGLVSHWSAQFANSTPASMIEVEISQGLDMLHLSPSFLLLLLGHGMGLVVFLMEIGFFAKKMNTFSRKKNRRVVKNLK
ncbi:uncharacterized protein [Neodiprion pinetum]|uniref:uncharacterized protein n=1 Tax=Neodiprion pinetum TaxID=441929 RepID=UPI0037240E48